MIKRKCKGCGHSCPSLVEVHSSDGYSVGLFGECCAAKIRAKIEGKKFAQIVEKQLLK